MNTFFPRYTHPSEKELKTNQTWGIEEKADVSGHENYRGRKSDSEKILPLLPEDHTTTGEDDHQVA